MNAAATFDSSGLPADVRLMRALANALFAVIGIGLLAAVLLALARLPVFNLRAIQIEGEVTRNSATALRLQALPALKGNFFTLDLRQGREAFQRVPWVRRAVLRRVWPNRLKVQLEEHQPAALWRGSTGADDRLVNQQGEVFEANVDEVEGERLPELAGPVGSAARVLALHRQLAPVFAQAQLDLDGLTLSDRGSWKAELATGAKVELGRGEPAEVLERTQRFLRTLPPVVQRFGRPLAHADLRHADGYALRLKGITTTIDAAPAKAAAPVKNRTR